MRDLDRAEGELTGARRLAAWIDPALVGGLVEPKVQGAPNPSLSRIGLDIARATKGRLDRDEWAKLRAFLRANFSSDKGEKATVLPPSIRNLIAAYYAAENDKLLESLGSMNLSEAFNRYAGRG
ncbi:hypothetical protein [Chelativorans sp. Marseille-P2723]|uniref:hypothetical protein n=1 Tax=Chelativorans sp. Marseille-P2723 TaxID=2709133 RepID=UPI00156DB6ED|nr:hypothetical protein [Chelativorans sp. Marseille-P2723]